MPAVRALVIGHDHIGDPGYVGRVLEVDGWSLHRFTVVPAARSSSCVSWA